jgi:hypothetical protein
MVADDFRVNRLGKVTPKTLLKKRAKSTDDAAVLTTDDEGSVPKAAMRKLRVAKKAKDIAAEEQGKVLEDTVAVGEDNKL